MVRQWRLAAGALVVALAFQGGRYVGEQLSGRGSLDCDALARQADLIRDFGQNLEGVTARSTVCLPPVPGWEWDAAWQTVDYRPFNRGQGDALVYRLRAQAPQVSIEGPTTVTGGEENTFSYVANAAGGASAEYTWTITPAQEFLFTGGGQARWGLKFLQAGVVDVCAQATDSAGISSENACLTVTVELETPDAPVLTGPDGEIAGGTAVVFTATTNGGAPGPVVWDLPAGAEIVSESNRQDDGPASVTFEVTIAETSQICVSVTDSGGGRGGPTCQTVEVPAITNITSAGSASASSMFANDPALNPGRAADNNAGTSWFSSGPGSGGATVFSWTATADFHITEVEFRGNGGHRVPGFRTGFRFATVQVLLLDAAINVIATRTGSGFGDSFV